MGTCVGTVHPDRVVLGQDIQPGDSIIGIASSGIHSNGLTLARRVLLDRCGYRLDEKIDALGQNPRRRVIGADRDIREGDHRGVERGHRDTRPRSHHERRLREPLSSRCPGGLRHHDAPRGACDLQTHPGRGRDRRRRDVPRVQHGGRLRHDRGRSRRGTVPRRCCPPRVTTLCASEPSPTKPGAYRCDLWDLWVDSRTEPATSLPSSGGF